MLFPCLIGLGLMGFIWLSHSLAVFSHENPNGWTVECILAGILAGVIGVFFIGACIGSFIILFKDKPER